MIIEWDKQIIDLSDQSIKQVKTIERIILKQNVIQILSRRHAILLLLKRHINTHIIIKRNEAMRILLVIKMVAKISEVLNIVKKRQA